MKESVKLYNDYLECTDYSKSKVLYENMQKACIKERIDGYLKKASFGKDFLELPVLPFVLIYDFIIN